MNSSRVLLVVGMCVFALAACGRKQVPVAVPSPPIPESEPATAAPPPSPDVDARRPSEQPAPLSEDEIFARKTLEELNAERPLSDAFFEFDQWNVRSDARTALEANAEWLRRWLSTRVMIEGHGDARGTSEYNLALGERRASAVKSYLVGLGIGAERMTVVSRGEESPFCAAETDGCWQLNRRGHFVITAK